LYSKVVGQFLKRRTQYLFNNEFKNKCPEMELIGNVIFDVLAMLVTLGILVTFHEYGHFWVARKCGVKVERFSIGFGKPLLRWQEKPRTVSTPGSPVMEPGTEFVIASIPLGGYVKMLGEQGHDVPEDQKQFSFTHKPLSQRAAIVAAGPIANFLLAIFLYWIMFMSGVTDFAPVVGKIEENSPAGIAGMRYGDEIIEVDQSETRTWQEARKNFLDRLGETGELHVRVKREDSTLPEDLVIPLQSWLVGEAEPDVLGSLGITPIYMDIPPRIGQLEQGGRALDAGFESGDLVVAVDGVAVDGWDEWVNIIRNSPETDLSVQVERRNQRVDLVLRPATRRNESGDLQLDSEGRSQGYIGAGVELPVLSESLVREIRFNPFSAMIEATKETWDNSLFVLVAIKKMIIGLMSVNNISGPITIAQIAGDSASDGIEYFIGFLAILSISLGVMNLLPIPVLDGGHLFYYAIEAVIRKPIPEQVQDVGLRLGLLMIAGIMFIAFYNDINRLF